MILGLKTDTPTAELLLINQDGTIIGREQWLAERRLAKELLARLETFLERYGATWNDLSGLIVYRGPGSFTGLRIGITVMNTIAYALDIPIAGHGGPDWYEAATKSLAGGDATRIVLPEYGAPARITQPRK